MTDGQDFDVKRCAKCAAWIPATATMCSYCNTTSPDKPPVRPKGNVLSLRHGVSATHLLIAVNIAFFVFSLAVAKARGVEGNVLQWALTGGGGFGEGMLLAGGYWHPLVVEGQWWRVLSATFLHYGAIHIGLNMLALRDVGRLAEELFGTAKFLAVYLLSGIGSTLAVSVWFVHVRHDPTGPLLAGASGAIFGVMGLLAVFLLRAGTSRAREIGRKLALDVVYMLAIGFMVPFISNTGHVGGLLVGVACGLFIKDRFASRLDPAAARAWTKAAAALVFVAGASLLAAAWFAVRAQEIG
jgi:membrane associated rhomboid family serine protease